MQLSKLITKIAQQFEAAKLCFGHGTDNAEDEAYALVFYMLKLPFDANESVFKKEITAQEIEQINGLVKQRIEEKIPLAYLTHEAYFAGLPFYVDERVIVPRSPFAELIEQGFEPWIRADKIKNVLDLCTGSGCMAIAAALALPDARIDAVELSDDALDVAKINVEKFSVNDRVSLIQSNLWEKVPRKKYDVIMSNPPYVGGEEMTTLPKEYLHEPDLALRAKDQGLSIVLEILRQANAYLSEQGILMVEIGNSKEALEKRLPKVPFTWLEFERGGGGVFLLGSTDCNHSSFTCLER